MMVNTSKQELVETFNIMEDTTVYNVIKELQRIQGLHHWLYLVTDNDEYEYGFWIKGVRLETDLEQSERIKAEEELVLQEKLQEEKLEAGRKQHAEMLKQKALLKAAPEMVELLRDILHDYETDEYIDNQIEDILLKVGRIDV